MEEKLIYNAVKTPDGTVLHSNNLEEAVKQITSKIVQQPYTT